MFLDACDTDRSGGRENGDGNLTAANLKEHERLMSQEIPQSLNGILKGGKLWRAGEKQTTTSGSNSTGLSSSDGRTEGDGGTSPQQPVRGQNLKSAAIPSKRGVRFSDSTAPSRSEVQRDVSFLVGGYMVDVADSRGNRPRLTRQIPTSSPSLSSDTDGESLSSQDTVIAVSPAAALKFQMAQANHPPMRKAAEESKEAKVLVLRAGESSIGNHHEEYISEQDAMMRSTAMMRRINSPSTGPGPQHVQQWGGKVMASDDAVLLKYPGGNYAPQAGFVVPVSPPTNAGVMSGAPGSEKYRTIPFDRPDKDWNEARQWTMAANYQHAGNCPVANVKKTVAPETLPLVTPQPPKGAGSVSREQGGVFSRLVKSIRGGKKDDEMTSPRGIGETRGPETLEGRLEPSQTANVAEARRKYLGTLSAAGERTSLASNDGDPYTMEDIDAALLNEEHQQAAIGARLAMGKPMPHQGFEMGGDGSTATTDSGYGSSLGEAENSDELAQFVAADADRMDRLRRKYVADHECEEDDGGFNRRPSVRGIKPRFGSTTEILQQMQLEMSPPGGYSGNHMTWPYGARGAPSPSPDNYGTTGQPGPTVTTVRPAAVVGKRAVRVPLPAVQEEAVSDDQIAMRVITTPSPLPAGPPQHEMIYRPDMHPALVRAPQPRLPPPNLRPPPNEEVRWQHHPPVQPAHASLPRGSYYGSHQQLSNGPVASSHPAPPPQNANFTRHPMPNLRPSQGPPPTRLPNGAPSTFRPNAPHQRSSWAGDPTGSYHPAPQSTPTSHQRYPRPPPPPRINSQVTTVRPSQNGPHPPRYISPPQPPQDVSPLKVGIHDERGAPEGASNSPPSSNDERTPTRN